MIEFCVTVLKNKTPWWQYKYLQAFNFLFIIILHIFDTHYTRY